MLVLVLMCLAGGGQVDPEGDIVDIIVAASRYRFVYSSMVSGMLSLLAGIVG
jgi:hypothetical protein